jgi:hypothetical protein
MKWTKLEYGEWPEGMILLRIDLEDGPQYEVGYIKRSKTNQDVYFYCTRPMPSKISIDSIYDIEPHYIALDAIELPKAEDNEYSIDPKLWKAMREAADRIKLKF